jgi:deoxyinosine 3'endonuclease (endonuclease V)
LKIWKSEQHHIASQVVIRDNDDWISTREAVPQEEHHNSNDDSHTKATTLHAARFKPLPRVGTKHALYGGVDVSFPQDDIAAPSVATYVILEATTLSVVYQDFIYFDLTIPYVSSFLSFREIESLEFLVRKQIRDSPHFTPLVVLVDGNGVLHARRAGIACFLGVRTGIPTIGIGKTLYCEDGLQKESVRASIDRTLLALLDDECTKVSSQIAQDERSRHILVDRINYRPDDLCDQSLVEREAILQQLAPVCRGIAVKLEGASGHVLCAALLGHGGAIGAKRKTKSGTKNPIYVSVGHNISLDESIALCVELSRARIPEPVRQADLWGRELLRQKSKKNME